MRLCFHQNTNNNHSQLLGHRSLGLLPWCVPRSVMRENKFKAAFSSLLYFAWSWLKQFSLKASRVFYIFFSVPVRCLQRAMYTIITGFRLHLCKRCECVYFSIVANKLVRRPIQSTRMMKKTKWRGKKTNAGNERKAAFLCKCLQITFINYYDSLAILCVSERLFPLLTLLLATLSSFSFFFSSLFTFGTSTTSSVKRRIIIIFINNSHQQSSRLSCGLCARSSALIPAFSLFYFHNSHASEERKKHINERRFLFSFCVSIVFVYDEDVYRIRMCFIHSNDKRTKHWIVGEKCWEKSSEIRKREGEGRLEI